jgi:tripartite ATP-independent transporter DctP family solute receptor
MVTKKRVIVSILSVMVVAVLAGLFPLIQGAQAKTKIIASSNVPKPDLESITLDLFKEYLKDSAPDLGIEVHYAAELGNEREVFEALQIGSIKLACVTTGVSSAFAPELGIFSLCYLYPSLDAAKRVADSDVAQKLSESVRKKTGVRVLGFIPKAFRVTISRKKPLKTLGDFKGYKLRLPKDPVLIDTFKLLGAKPTPIPWGDVYTSLKTGVVDGMESTPSAIYTMKFWETTDYMTVTNHQLLWYALLINESLYQSLSPDAQKAIQVAAKKAVAGSIDRVKSLTDKYIKLLSKEHKEVYHPDLKPFMKAVEPTYASFGEKTGTTELVEEVKKIVE